MSELWDCLPKDSWLREWLGCWPTSEPPKSFILFAGMSMMGSMIGRRCYFDQDTLRIYPMLNLLLVGNSGIGKSVTLNHLGLRLIREMPREQQPQQVVGTAGVEKLHWDLRGNPHAILVAAELANFFGRQKYLEGLVEYVTELLDYLPYVERRFKNSDVVQVVEPAVTVVGGSTIEWLQEALPDSAVGGGFLPRFLIVYEQHKGQRVALPGKSLGRTERAELEERRRRMINRFYELVTSFTGAVDFRGYEDADAYTVWYSHYQAPTGHLSPFANRAGEYVLRMSILIAISCGRKEIYGSDIRAAIRLYEYCLNRLQAVVVPFTPSGKQLQQVMVALGTQALTKMELCHALKQTMKSQDVEQLLISLRTSGDVILTEEGKLRKK